MISHFLPHGNVWVLNVEVLMFMSLSTDWNVVTMYANSLRDDEYKCIQTGVCAVFQHARWSKMQVFPRQTVPTDNSFQETAQMSWSPHVAKGFADVQDKEKLYCWRAYTVKLSQGTLFLSFLFSQSFWQMLYREVSSIKKLPFVRLKEQLIISLVPDSAFDMMESIKIPNHPVAPICSHIDLKWSCFLSSLSHSWWLPHRKLPRFLNRKRIAEAQGTTVAISASWRHPVKDLDVEDEMFACVF